MVSTPALNTVDRCHLPVLCLVRIEICVAAASSVPNINKMFRLLITQKSINIDDQWIRREDMHMIIMLGALQILHVRIDERFCSSLCYRHVFVGDSIVFLWCIPQARRSQEDIQTNRNNSDFNNRSPAERLVGHTDAWQIEVRRLEDAGDEVWEGPFAFVELCRRSGVDEYSWNRNTAHLSMQQMVSMW